jgi:hypothetical protein
MPADLKRLHKYMLEIEHISVISDEVRRGMAGACPQAAVKSAGIISMSALGAFRDMRCRLAKNSCSR